MAQCSALTHRRAERGDGVSFDLAVWAEDAPVTAQRAGATYRRLCAGDPSGLVADGRVGAFVAELLARFPETDDLDAHPWASTVDTSACHALLPITRSRAADVVPVVYELAARHGLVVFDPQARAVHQAPTALRLRMADGSVVDRADERTLRG